MAYDRIRLLLVTFWVGSLWTIGYVAAPTLFATLSDRALAGTIAGSLFRVEAWISLVCGMALILLQVIKPISTVSGQNKRWIGIIAAMLVCTLIGHFVLQPMMADLRAAAGAAGVLEGDVKAKFGALHGAASSVYLFQSLLAALLMFRTSAR